MRILSITKKLGVAILSVSALMSCSSDVEVTSDNVKQPRKDINLSEQTRATANSLRDFYIKFTNDMAEYNHSTEFRDENVVTSPLSAAMVFSMIANGVSESDRKNYCDYLGSNDIQSLNKLCSTLLEQLPSCDNTASLTLANSIWVNQGMGLSLNKDYSSIMSNLYRSDIRYADFSKDNRQTLNAINDWAATNTKGLISDYMTELNSQDMAILLNTMYFNAIWSNRIFDEKNTHPATFHGTAGDSEVQMMKSNCFDSRFATDGNLDFFIMDFGNESFFMEIITPSETPSDVAQFLPVTVEQINSLRQKASLYTMEINMPKFTAGHKYNLNLMLENSGRKELTTLLKATMFENEELCNILFKQGATLTIDEKGAEAAAVTSGEVPVTAVIADGKVTVTLDHPFYFFINEHSTGACILSGRINSL